MNLQTIKNYCEKREGGVKQLAKDIGMSEPNLHRCIRLNQIQAGDLERIAQVLNVNVGVFFDETTPHNVSTDGNIAISSNNPVGNVSLTGNNNQLNGHGAHGNINGDVNAAILTERVKSLEANLAEKDERISEFKERIEELKERIEELKEQK